MAATMAVTMAVGDVGGDAAPSPLDRDTATTAGAAAANLRTHVHSNSDAVRQNLSVMRVLCAPLSMSAWCFLIHCVG